MLQMLAWRVNTIALCWSCCVCGRPYFHLHCTSAIWEVWRSYRWIFVQMVEAVPGVIRQITQQCPKIYRRDPKTELIYHLSTTVSVYTTPLAASSYPNRKFSSYFCQCHFPPCQCLPFPINQTGFWKSPSIKDCIPLTLPKKIHHLKERKISH